ncbi:hypothetical protein U1Q18_031552 [Sarracenia purpurea var. burkii]
MGKRAPIGKGALGRPRRCRSGTPSSIIIITDQSIHPPAHHRPPQRTDRRSPALPLIDAAHCRHNQGHRRSKPRIAAITDDFEFKRLVDVIGSTYS